MANLRKYQINAIVDDICEKIKNKKSEKEENSDYKDFIKSQSEKVETLLKEREFIKQELQSNQDELKELLELSSYTIPSKRTCKDYVIRQARKKFEIQKPSKSEIERAVILSDLNGSEDIVETVMKKLGYE